MLPTGKFEVRETTSVVQETTSEVRNITSEVQETTNEVRETTKNPGNIPVLVGRGPESYQDMLVTFRTSCLVKSPTSLIAGYRT